MLSKEQNERLTQVGPGTPGGNLLRRYWQALCPADEITAEHPKKRPLNFEAVQTPAVAGSERIRAKGSKLDLDGIVDFFHVTQFGIP